MTRRPLIPRALAAVVVIVGILIVLFPHSRWVAYPGAVLAEIALLLLLVRWKDLSDPKLWSGTPPDSPNSSS
jgi:protein-S-isoprenylcysteine O-methyltransferase Ste14